MRHSACFSARGISTLGLVAKVLQARLLELVPVNVLVSASPTSSSQPSLFRAGIAVRRGNPGHQRQARGRMQRAVDGALSDSRVVEDRLSPRRC